MNTCPITYEQCTERYSRRGLNLLSKKLQMLVDIPYTADELRKEAAKRAVKMSVQGIQPKLSAILVPSKNTFEVVDTGGKFILKPQSGIYNEMPENEDLSMKLAKTVGIEVPLHGLVHAKAGVLTYFIKRFDRLDSGKKIHVEDFAQIAGESRDTKYDFSMEKLIPIINDHCTSPMIEKAKLLNRIIFNFLIGNEDMHLKNYSLITKGGIVQLAPAYDFLNTTIALDRAEEEFALPLKGKKKNITKQQILNYYALEKLKLNEKVIENTMEKFQNSLVIWKDWISKSFLSDNMKMAYLDLVIERANRLGLNTEGLK